MSNALTKLKFSGSTDGKPIQVAQTATAGDLIHTAVAGTITGKYDEIWLWAANISAADVVLTIEFGGATSSGNLIYTVSAKDGLKCILPGLVLQNGATVRAFAATTAVINIFGFVNQIVPS